MATWAALSGILGWGFRTEPAGAGKSGASQLERPVAGDDLRGVQTRQLLSLPGHEQVYDA